MKKLLYILFSLLLFSCVQTDYDDNEFDYDYVIKSYYNNPDKPENFRYAEYYLNDTLIRRIGNDGGCTTFKYDKAGRLLETKWGRNCDYGWRTIFIYDSLNNHIGYYKTNDTVINLDTVKVDQIFFFDNQNRLIKERTGKRKDMEGNEFEKWKHYKYSDSRVDREIIIRDLDTIWNGKLDYDSIGNIIKIHRTRGQVYETELFLYDNQGHLIEKEIISTANPITPKVIFSAGNNKRVYEYDSDGFLKAETVYNHKGKIEIKTIYVKELITKTP